MISSTSPLPFALTLMSPPPLFTGWRRIAAQPCRRTRRRATRRNACRRCRFSHAQLHQQCQPAAPRVRRSKRRRTLAGGDVFPPCPLRSRCRRTPPPAGQHPIRKQPRGAEYPSDFGFDRSRKRVPPIRHQRRGRARADAGHAVLEKLYRQTFAQPVRHPHQPALRLYHPAPLQQYRKRQHRPRFGALQRQPGQQQIPQRRLRRMAQPLAMGLTAGYKRLLPVQMQTLLNPV